MLAPHWFHTERKNWFHRWHNKLWSAPSSSHPSAQKIAHDAPLLSSSPPKKITYISYHTNQIPLFSYLARLTMRCSTAERNPSRMFRSCLLLLFYFSSSTDELQCLRASSFPDAISWMVFFFRLSPS